MTKDFRAAFYPNQYYHIFNHAIGSEQLFLSADNYYYFLHLFTKHICPVADVFCYCLLPNHFHFFLAVKPALVLNQQIEVKNYKHTDDTLLYPDFLLQQFSNFFNAYTRPSTSNKAARANCLSSPSTAGWLTHRDII